MNSWSVLLEDETVCLLTDICVERSYVYIVDNENKNVKRYRNSDNGFEDFIILHDPCGICKLLLSSHIVVTEPCNRHLTYISVEGNMVLSSRRKTTKQYGPIRCLDETKLVVGCSELGNASVDILDYTGKVLNSIYSKENELSRFLTPSYIACYDEQYIIVSDSGTRNVSCINNNGKLEWVMEFKCSPSGISTNNLGNLFISLFEEGRVVMMDKIKDGKITGSLESVKVKNPLALSHSRGFIYVTQEMPSDKIFKIQIDDDSDESRLATLANIHLFIKDTTFFDSDSSDNECIN